MTADYNGWNDAPEAEREAIEVYTRQEFEREAVPQLVDEEITQAIDSLPETYRSTVLLRDLPRLPGPEVARILGVPEGTVKSRLFHARRILRTNLRKYVIEMGYPVLRVS